MPAAKRSRTSSGYSTGGQGQSRGGGGPAGYGYMLNKYYPSSTHFQRAVPRTAETAERYGWSRKTADPLQVANRDLDRMTGHGKYSFGKNLRSMGQAVQGYSKSLGVGGLRKQFADKARSMASSKIAGMGSYASAGLVSGNGMYVDNSSSVLRKGQYHGPNYSSFRAGHGQDDGSVIVGNQEFYQYIYAPAADGGNIGFTSFSVDVQPGTMSPLLAQMAGNFERYELQQCMFHFETSLDGAALQSTTGQVGDIMMVSHMDVTQPDYSNASEFEHNSSHVISARVTQGLTCGVECDSHQMDGLTNGGVNFVRTAGVETNEKDKYDQARVQIALNNLNPALAGRCIGRLYVSYTCKLIKQRLHSSIGRGIESDEFNFVRDNKLAKISEAPMDFFVKPTVYCTGVDAPGTGVPIVLPTKEPWSNLGVSIVNPSYATSARSDDIDGNNIANCESLELLFPGNLSGFFRVSFSADWIVSDAVGSDATPDTNCASFTSSFIRQLITSGNVDIVAERFKKGSGEDIDMILDYDATTMTQPLVTNYLTQQGANDATDIGLGRTARCAGICTFYVRLSPSTSNVENKLKSVFYSTSGSSAGSAGANKMLNNITKCSIRVERANDHGRLGDLTYSELFGSA